VHVADEGNGTPEPQRAEAEEVPGEVASGGRRVGLIQRTSNGNQDGERHWHLNVTPVTLGTR
jgi:hypothetical protein